MLSLAFWFLVGCGIAYFLFYLLGTILEIITLIGDCCLGDNGGILIWIILIVGGLIMLFL
jgi:hypothetical protein